MDNRVFLVTGATGALGSAVAKKIAEDGSILLIPYRSDKSMSMLSELVSSASDKVLFQKTELTKQSDVEELVNVGITRWGNIHAAVCLAGSFKGGKTIEDTEISMWEEMYMSNVLSTLHVCRAVLPVMKRNNFGRIVTIGAKAGLSPMGNAGAYAMSKASVMTLTRTIAEEVKGTRITANVIAPGTIATEANRSAMPKADQRQWVSPAEIANWISFLCSDDSRSVNGQIITVG
ncbi:MAG TPA: SDR family NAD(P)-dependent oxidoreductase [Bacteroidota bacterium]